MQASCRCASSWSARRHAHKGPSVVALRPQSLSAYAGRVVVHMRWEWAPDGIGAGDFDTAQAAADGLGASARRTYTRYEQHVQREAMLACIAPLQERMLSEGVESIAAGGSWSGRCGGVTVTLSPRCPGGSHSAP